MAHQPTQQQPKPLTEGQTKGQTKPQSNAPVNMGPPPKPIKPTKNN
jgi:hypothetical protein